MIWNSRVCFERGMMMTNREKYAKEILDIACVGEDVAVKNGVPCKCGETDCNECDFHGDGSCTRRLVKWCNSEYIEDPVDWSKVPIDTPIWVRSSANEQWVKRHFAKYENGAVYAFVGYGTSWSGSNCRYRKYAKLATDDELNANSILRADRRKEK